MTCRDGIALVLAVAMFAVFLVNPVWGLLAAAVLAPIVLRTCRAPTAAPSGPPSIERIDDPDRESSGAA